MCRGGYNHAMLTGWCPVCGSYKPGRFSRVPVRILARLLLVRR
jgi:hypothetical protein